MERTEATFIGLGGLSVYHQSWLPDGAPRAVLLVVHGWAEHSGRYWNVVDHFVAKGYAVHALDHRGHGRSEGRRGYVARFTDYVEDLKTFFDIVRGQRGGGRIFLVGHSMGGTIATAYAIRHQHELAGMILSGASLQLGASLSSALMPFARILSMLVPKLGVAVLDASAISQDEDVVEAYVNDPLVYRGKFTCRFGAEMLLALRSLPAQIPQLELPLLIMHGGADRLSAPEGSRVLYDRVSSADKKLEVYDGLHHEIFNEPDRHRVLGDMESWLAVRTGA
jgi:alpha-beta hydrolase superfamily lysophospholipase